MKFHLVMLPFIQSYLEPTEILCEILFGLIMVLTFTLGAGLVVNDGVSATRTLLLAILGCNIAWGLIDGVMHIMSCMLERSRKAQLLKALQSVESEAEGLRLVENSFERGLATVENPEEDPFADGMNKVYKQFTTALDELGVTVIEAVGKEFDPNLHNAVMHVEDESVGENIVVEEFQKGYTYKDFVVRHSMVKVAN